MQKWRHCTVNQTQTDSKRAAYKFTIPDSHSYSSTSSIIGTMLVSQFSFSSADLYWFPPLNTNNWRWSKRSISHCTLAVAGLTTLELEVTNNATAIRNKLPCQNMIPTWKIGVPQIGEQGGFRSLLHHIAKETQSYGYLFCCFCLWQQELVSLPLREFITINNLDKDEWPTQIGANNMNEPACLASNK